MTREVHLAQMREKRKVYWWESQNERDHLEEKDVDGG
jgi:hypothetical protein